MSYGSPWSEAFVRQLSDKEVRSEFVADHVRARLAQLIRSLREQPDRNWTQAELGERAGKPQNVISRFEDPNYGKMSLQSLFDLAAAFDLPVWIDMPAWDEWLALINDARNRETHRSGFDLERLAEQARIDGAAAASAMVPISGAAASAAAESIRNMVFTPPQMRQIPGAMNANALSTASNELPLERLDNAMGAVAARNMAA